MSLLAFAFVFLILLFLSMQLSLISARQVELIQALALAQRGDRDAESTQQGDRAA
jgi:hypothetical protein